MPDLSKAKLYAPLKKSFGEVISGRKFVEESTPANIAKAVRNGSDATMGAIMYNIAVAENVPMRDVCISLGIPNGELDTFVAIADLIESGHA